MATVNAYGHVIVNVVDGTQRCGVYSTTGALNVVNTTGGTTFVGAYHPCGALNVCYVPSVNARTGAQAPTGAMYVVNGDTSIRGQYHPCGAMQVQNFVDLKIADGYPADIFIDFNTGYIYI